MAYENNNDMFGFQNMNNLIMSLAQTKRQQQDDELRGLQAQELRQNMADRQGLRSALSSVQPTVTGSITDNRPQMPQQPNQGMLGGLSALGQMPQQPQAPSPFPATQPDFQMRETVTQPSSAQYERAALEYYGKTDPEKATKFHDAILNRVSKMAELGQPEKAVAYYSEVVGQPLEYKGSKDDFIHFGAGGKEYLFNVRTKETQEFGEAKQDYKDREIVTGPDMWQKEESYTGGAEGSWKPVGKPYRKREANSGGGTEGLGKLDIEGVKSLIKTLPKLPAEAIGANGGIERIDTMLGLIKGGVGGKKGQILATIAPYAEAAGIESKAMNDAQVYEILAKTIGGSMRMQMVGPGQVSNYENQLLQKISGGGSAASAAASELLTYYKKIAEEKIEDYNSSVELIRPYSKATANVYKKVERQKSPSPASDTGSGKTYSQTATNPQTKQKIGSNDGGKTWYDVQTGKPLR